MRDKTVTMILRKVIAHNEVLWVRADTNPDALGLHVEVPKSVVEQWERIRDAQFQVGQEVAGYYEQAVAAREVST